MCLDLSGILYPVLQGTVHNEAAINVGCGQRMPTSMSVTLPVSLYLHGNLLMTL